MHRSFVALCLRHQRPAAFYAPTLSAQFPPQHGNHRRAHASLCTPSLSCATTESAGGQTQPLTQTGAPSPSSFRRPKHCSFAVPVSRFDHGYGTSMHRGYSTSSDTGNASDRGGRCGGGDRADIAMYGMGTVASGNVYQDMPHAVGNTPLIKLRKASELTGCTILGKCEFENPGGSVKDRAALNMIMEAEKRGDLIHGEPGIIVEGTAGNTGIGLTAVGNARGYQTIICIAETQSQEKKDTLRWGGAELVEVPAVPFADRNNYVHIAQRLADKLKAEGRRVLYANQWDNPANREAHIKGTGPEIWAQTEGKIDAFSCAVGTGGTLAGCAQYFRSISDDIKIALTDPCGAALYSYYTNGELQSNGSSITEGIGQGRITGNLQGFSPDMAFEIEDGESLPVLFDLLKNEGLCLGTSSAVNVLGAMKVARELGPGHTIVTILCDSGTRYASKIYNPTFLKARGLPCPSWLDPQRQTPDSGVSTSHLRGVLTDLIK